MSCGSVFVKGDVLNIKDAKDNEFYRAKIVKVDEEHESVKVHYVGWNERYDEILSISLPRIKKLQDSADVMGAVGGAASLEKESAVAGEPLNASSIAAGSGGLSVRSCSGHATSESVGGDQHAGMAAKSDACGVCPRSLGAQLIVCSGCDKKFHAETICVSVEEKVILILHEDTLGAVKFYCCGCRMAPRESQDVGGSVSLGYAQLLRVVGTLIVQVRSLMGNGAEQPKGMCASSGRARSNEESF